MLTLNVKFSRSSNNLILKGITLASLWYLAITLLRCAKTGIVNNQQLCAQICNVIGYHSAKYNMDSIILKQGNSAPNI